VGPTILAAVAIGAQLLMLAAYGTGPKLSQLKLSLQEKLDMRVRSVYPSITTGILNTSSIGK
jgi:hypothetical protein